MPRRIHLDTELGPQVGHDGGGVRMTNKELGIGDWGLEISDFGFRISDLLDEGRGASEVVSSPCLCEEEERLAVRSPHDPRWRAEGGGRRAE